jgi:hypothetical protein
MRPRFALPHWRRIAGTVAILALSALASGCGSADPAGPSPTTTTTTTVAPGPPAPPAAAVTTPPPPPPPVATQEPTTTEAPPPAYYANCAAAKAAGAAPLHRGDPGYRPALDRDGDGTACEK